MILTRFGSAIGRNHRTPENAGMDAPLAVGHCGGLGVEGSGVDGALFDPPISSSIAAAEVGGSGLHT